MFVTDVSNWFLVFARAGAMLAALPMFSMRTFPVQIRVALGAMIAFLLVPTLPAPNADLSSFWTLTALLFQEVSVGLLLGFICRFAFFAMEIGGGFIATQMGLMLPQEFNQLTDGGAMAPAMALYWMALMMFFSLDLHHWMIAAFQQSYVLVPAGGGVLREGLLNQQQYLVGMLQQARPQHVNPPRQIGDHVVVVSLQNLQQTIEVLDRHVSR